MALHPPSQLFWGCAAVVGPVPAGSSQPGGRLGNWQPTANDCAFDTGVGSYAAGEITRAASGVPRIYCAHTGLLSVAAKAPRINFCPRKPVRQNVALQIFPQVTLYICRHRVYYPSCAGIQPARAPPACAISTAQDYHANVWSNSNSGIGSASTVALCNNRSCPASTTARIWVNGAYIPIHTA